MNNSDTHNIDINFDLTLDHFFQKYQYDIKLKTGHLPSVSYDPQSPSPCQVKEDFLDSKQQRSISWQAIKKDSQDDLLGMENALEITIHPSIHAFFSRYWSAQIDAIYQQGNLSLLFIWNKQDMQRLIENQMGHALSKIRSKNRLTFFIACTDADYMLSIDNESGEIVLERPGYPIEKVLAPNLDSFLNELEYGRL